MVRSLLACFRGADGRSLARALSVLLVVGGWLGAFDSGIVVGTNGVVLCVADSGRPADPASPATPIGQDRHICCILGCAAASPGVVGTESRLDAAPATESAGKPARTFFSSAVLRPATASPRGPPRLA